MQCEIGVYGLGVMGTNIAKNMLNHGFNTAVFSVSDAERDRFPVYDYKNTCVVCSAETELINTLKKPRIILLMITAGKAVDQVIKVLLPKLGHGDVIIDGGNSYYQDTERRCGWCAEHLVHYVGAGVSGGELGALNGPSIMPGGSHEGYQKVKEILTSIAADIEGVPCCAYVGKGGSGHYVKMVHNGIEYAILQLIGETYMIMRHVMAMSHQEILSAFKVWEQTKLNSYLLSISVLVMEKCDDDRTPLIDRIMDVAEQKGTGKWTALESIERGVYAPGIYEAVLARNFSTRREVRQRGAKLLTVSKIQTVSINLTELGEALLAGMALSFSQGMELIQKASVDYGWNIDLMIISDVWRDGCIIRSSLLENVKAGAEENEEALVLTQAYQDIRKLEASLRAVVVKAEAAGMASTGFSAALHYYDYFHLEDFPVRFIQALRDCFGAHTYMRNDKPGYFHTEWGKKHE